LALLHRAAYTASIGDPNISEVNFYISFTASFTAFFY